MTSYQSAKDQLSSWLRGQSSSCPYIVSSRGSHFSLYEWNIWCVQSGDCFTCMMRMLTQVIHLGIIRKSITLLSAFGVVWLQVWNLGSGVLIWDLESEFWGPSVLTASQQLQLKLPSTSSSIRWSLKAQSGQISTW